MTERKVYDLFEVGDFTMVHSYLHWLVEQPVNGDCAEISYEIKIGRDTVNEWAVIDSDGQQEWLAKIDKLIDGLSDFRSKITELDFKLVGDK